MTGSTRQAIAAECVGSLLLAATVIGSGIMAERLAGGNAALALLANTGCDPGPHNVCLPLWQASTHARTGWSQWLAEIVATFGLLCVVLGHQRSRDAPWMVAAWIGAAYWFTSSTSFANPAITVARILEYVCRNPAGSRAGITEKWKKPPVSWHAAKAQLAIQFAERFVSE